MRPRAFKTANNAQDEMLKGNIGDNMNERIDDREYEIDLLELVRMLWDHKWIILATALLTSILALCVAAFYLPEKFEAYTTMYVKNGNSDVINEDGAIKLTDLNASKSLVTTHIAVLKSNTVMKEVSKRLTAKYMREGTLENYEKLIEPERIEKSFTMSAVDDTEVLKISAKTTSPEVTADICNTIADIAPDFLIRVVGAGSVEVIDRAEPDYEPSEPNVKKVTVLGGLLGFMAAAGVLVILYLLDNSVKSIDELTKKFDKAIIGEVYNFSQEKGEKRKKQKKGERRDISPENLINDQTVFTVAESYKTMRTNAVFALAPFENRVFAVTSANAAEGKSTTTANLAIAFAQTENKVLLIDADMRKPTQHKLFEVDNKTGLSSAIGKMSKTDACIHRNVRKNLDLMSAGPIPPNPSELLASQQFENILKELADRYDYVIIDSPPVNVVSDVLVMNKSIAGAMFVTKYASTTYDGIEMALNKLELADIKMLGFILNNIVKPHAGKYYSYKYKYGYKYGYGYGYGYGYSDQNADKADHSDGSKKHKTK